MFIPEGNAKTFSIHIYRNILYSLAIFITIFVAGFLSLLLKSGEIAAKLQLVHVLTRENKELKEENRKLNFIRTKIDNIESLGEYLRRIAAVAGENTKKPPYAVSVFKQNEGTVFKKDGIEETADKIRLSTMAPLQEAKPKTETSEGYQGCHTILNPPKGG